MELIIWSAGGRSLKASLERDGVAFSEVESFAQFVDVFEADGEEYRLFGYQDQTGETWFWDSENGAELAIAVGSPKEYLCDRL